MKIQAKGARKNYFYNFAMVATGGPGGIEKVISARALKGPLGPNLKVNGCRFLEKSSFGYCPLASQVSTPEGTETRQTG